MANEGKEADRMRPNHALTVEQRADETGAQALARRLLEPQFRPAASASAFASRAIAIDATQPGLMDYVNHLEKLCEEAEQSDPAIASRLLAAQAMTLDTMFTELLGRMARNMDAYPAAAERYGRLALKAQANSRATLQALGKLHQPREQTVRHVHVNQAGNAVVADHFHHHAVGGGMDFHRSSRSFCGCSGRYSLQCRNRTGSPP